MMAVVSLYIPPNLRSLAGGHTEWCVKLLAGIVSHLPEWRHLLYRGWGHAPQPHAENDGEHPRQIIEGGDED